MLHNLAGGLQDPADLALAFAEISMNALRSRFTAIACRSSGLSKAARRG